MSQQARKSAGRGVRSKTPTVHAAKQNFLRSLSTPVSPYRRALVGARRRLVSTSASSEGSNNNVVTTAATTDCG